MQINSKNNSEQPKKLKGIIARNQEIGDKINNDTLGAKVENTVNHSTEMGLKTSISDKKETSLPKNYVDVRRKKNDTHNNTRINSPLISLNDNEVVNRSVQRVNYARSVNGRKAVNVKAKNHAKINKIESQEKSEIARNVAEKKKKVEIKSKISRKNTVINRKVNRNTEITSLVRRKVNNSKRKIKSAPNLNSKRLNPADVDKLRVIKKRYNSAIKNRVKRNITITKRRNRAIQAQKKSVLQTGQLRKPRLIKIYTVRVVGNIKAVRKIKLSQKVYKAIFGKLRLKILKNRKIRKLIRKAAHGVRIAKVVSKYMSYGIGTVSAPILKVGKKAVSLGSNSLNNAMKNVNYDDISDTGTEALKFMYKNASDTVTAIDTSRHIATGVKKTIRTGIKTTADIVKATPGAVRSIPGKVRQVARTGRKIKTNVKHAFKAVKHVVSALKKGGGKAAAKEMAKIARKTAEMVGKAALESFKLIARAVELIISNLPVILIAVAVVIVVILLIQGIGALVSAVSGSISSTVNWAFADYDASEPKNIYMLLAEYDKKLDDKITEEKQNKLDDATSFLTEDDDYYAVLTDKTSGDWIALAGGAGTTTANNMLSNGITLDKNEFYALLFVYLQKMSNEADGNDNYDVYEITFTAGEIDGFINKYFDISVSKASGLTCPGEDCHIKYCSGGGGCSNQGTEVVYKYDDKGNVIGSYTVTCCNGHPYCDNAHKKSSITFIKNSDIMDDLDFTPEEKERVEIVEQMFEEVILGDVLGQGENEETEGETE